jgi:hypothetical protein
MGPPACRAPGSWLPAANDHFTSSVEGSGGVPGGACRSHKQVLHRPVEPRQYTAIRYSDRLLDAGAVACIGTVGDSYDTQSIIALVDVGSLV